MRYLITFFLFLTSCTSDNKKGGDFTYKIIDNITDKQVIIKAYKESYIIDSFSINPHSTKTDTMYNGNGLQEDFYPEYIFADSLALFFNNEKVIVYTVYFNPYSNYNLINNKNILGVGWNEISSYTKKKTSYTTVNFTINEQDYMLADSL